MSEIRETIFDEAGKILFGPENYLFSHLNTPGSFFVRCSKSYLVISSECDPESGTVTTIVKPHENP